MSESSKPRATDGPDDTGLAADAHTDLAGELTYSGYLQLDRILDAQDGLSGSHDEMLFIVIHQATELWMKLAIHELRAAGDRIADDDLRPSFKMLSRVSRIQSQLVQSWDVLSTLTPAEYLAFRDRLGRSSGFQSYQYRTIEFLMGNKNRAMLQPHTHDPAVHAALSDTLAGPSIYDAAIGLLAQRGFDIGTKVLKRDRTVPWRRNVNVAAAWAAVYRDTAAHWDLYELAEKLVDLEDWFQQWRFRHLTTVERIIGRKRGTGGTTGVDYLRRALDIRFFPELWDLRTDLTADDATEDP